MFIKVYNIWMTILSFIGTLKLQTYFLQEILTKSLILVFQSGPKPFLPIFQLEVQFTWVLKDLLITIMAQKLMYGHLVSWFINFYMGRLLWIIVELSNNSSSMLSENLKLKPILHLNLQLWFILVLNQMFQKGFVFNS